MMQFQLENLSRQFLNHSKLTWVKIKLDQKVQHQLQNLSRSIPQSLNFDLSYNKIGSEGATSIAESLKINSSITQINLGFNKIGSEGATSIAESLKINSSITQINLSSCKIGSRRCNINCRISQDQFLNHSN